jgi:hypothetical protein
VRQDIPVECDKLLRRPLLLNQLSLVVLALPLKPLALPALSLPDTPPLTLDRDARAFDGELNRFEKPLECTVAEEEDVMTGLTGIYVLVPVIVEDVRRENDVSRCDEEDPLAVTTFGDKEAASAFSPSRRCGTDAETKSGGKRPTGLYSPGRRCQGDRGT